MYGAKREMEQRGKIAALIEALREIARGHTAASAQEIARRALAAVGEKSAKARSASADFVPR